MRMGIGRHWDEGPLMIAAVRLAFLVFQIQSVWALKLRGIERNSAYWYEITVKKDWNGLLFPSFLADLPVSDVVCPQIEASFSQALKQPIRDLKCNEFR